MKREHDTKATTLSQKNKIDSAVLSGYIQDATGSCSTAESLSLRKSQECKMKIYFINTDRNVKFVKGKLINNMRECLQIRVPDDIRGQEIYTATSKEEAVKKYIQEFPHVKEWAEKNDLPLTGAIENNVISVSEIHRRF